MLFGTIRGVFLCFFLLSFRPCAQNGILWIFMRFWAYFRLHFLSFLQQGGSSLFCNPSKQNHDFQGSRASIFQCFFLIFSAFHSGPHFSSFFNDFRVAKAPVLELVGLIFRHQKKESKKGLRLFASVREYWRGGIPLNKITFSPEGRFSTSVHSSCAWRHGGGFSKSDLANLISDFNGGHLPQTPAFWGK